MTYDSMIKHRVSHFGPSPLMLIMELFTTHTVEASSTEGMSRSGALLGKATQSKKRTQVEKPHSADF